MKFKSCKFLFRIQNLSQSEFPLFKDETRGSAAFSGTQLLWISSHAWMELQRSSKVLYFHRKGWVWVLAYISRGRHCTATMSSAFPLKVFLYNSVFNRLLFFCPLSFLERSTLLDIMKTSETNTSGWSELSSAPRSSSADQCRGISHSVVNPD